MTTNRLISLLLLLTLLGCGTPAHNPLGGSQTGATAFEPNAVLKVRMRPQSPVQPGFKTASLLQPQLVLPQPALQSGGRQTSSGANVFTVLDGAEFSPTASQNQVSKLGNHAEFLPNGSTSLTDLAYCTFDTTLSTLPTTTSVGYLWNEQYTPLPTDIYIGLSNWTRNSWEWFQGDADGIITIPGWADYVDGSNRILVMVLVTGSSRGLLRSVSLGEDEERGTGLDPSNPSGPTPPLYQPPLPNAVDLSPDCAPVNDQMTWGSCTAFAFADGAYNYILGNIYGRLGWDLTDSDYRLSPDYLYVSSGQRYGWPAGGEYGRYMYQLGPTMKQDGSAAETHAPYDLIYDTNWTADTLADAATLKIDAESWIPSSGAAGRQTIKGLLANASRPVIVGMYLDPDFPYYEPGTVYNYVGPPIGGHAMCIVGYDDQRQAYKVRNSWSASWGENGYIWISYATFDNPYANTDCYVIDDSYDPSVVARFLPGGDALPPPAVLSASDGTLQDEVSLNWADVPAATGYKIYRDTPQTLLATVGNVETYTDSTALPGYSHLYWVTATDSSVESAHSNSDIGYRMTGVAIVGVTPGGGSIGQTVTMQPQTWGGATYFNWDFGGGATPNTSTEQMPEIVLGAEGTYQATLIAGNAMGEDTYNFTLSVGPTLSPIASIGADTTNGYAPLTVNFNSSSSYDPDGQVVLYEWDWNEDGVWDEQTTLPYSSHTFNDPGHYYVWVRVTDNSGDTSKIDLQIVVSLEGVPYARLSANPISGPAPLDVSFKVSDSYDNEGSIVLYELDFEDDGTYDYSQSGNSNVSHTYTVDGRHTCRLRVTDNDNKTAEETEDVIVGLGDMPPGWVGYSLTSFPSLNSPEANLTTIAGRPAALINNWSSPWGLRFAYANVAEPGTAADWQVSDMPASLNGQFHDIIDNASAPVVAAYYDQSTPHKLLYARYDGANWVSHTVDDIAGGAGQYCQLAMVGGKPAIAYLRYYSGVQHLAYSRATVNEPTATADWIRSEVSTSSEPAKVYGLLESGGVPVVAFGRRNGSDIDLGIAYATDGTPDSSSDWTNYAALTDFSQSNAELFLINSLPAIVFNNELPSPNDSRIARANIAVPTLPTDWQVHVYALDYDAVSWGTGAWDGTPFVISYHDTGGLQLYHANTADPWAFVDWTRTELFSGWLVAGLDAAAMPFDEPGLIATRNGQNHIYFMYRLP